METSGIIYLVRHCATRNDEANYPIALGQRLDPGLSEKGKQHAQTLADYFGSKGLDAMYSSPAKRAVQTARLLGRDTDASMTFCTSLREIDMGDWEGKTYEEMKSLDLDHYDRSMLDPGTYGYPGGESLSDVCKRAMAFMDRIVTDHPYDRVAVVTHKYVNRAVLAHMMGLPMTRVREIDQDPGCVNVIRVFRGVMELQAVNYTSNFDLVEEDATLCTSRSNILV